MPSLALTTGASYYTNEQQVGIEPLGVNGCIKSVGFTDGGIKTYTVAYKNDNGEQTFGYFTHAELTDPYT